MTAKKPRKPKSIGEITKDDLAFVYGALEKSNNLMQMIGLQSKTALVDAKKLSQAEKIFYRELGILRSHLQQAMEVIAVACGEAQDAEQHPPVS